MLHYAVCIVILPPWISHLPPCLPLPAETRSHVPADGRLLAASGDPLPRQVPLLPQTRRRVCSVNTQFKGEKLPDLATPLFCNWLGCGCVARPCLCFSSEPEEGLLLSARSLRKTCFCNRCLTPGRKRRTRRTRSTAHLTTPTTTRLITTYICTHW